MNELRKCCIVVGFLGGLVVVSFAEEPTEKRDAAKTGDAKVVAADSFDRKLSLKWRIIRPEPVHVSLVKNKGKLTILTQRGCIHGDEKKDEFGKGIQAKNIFVIENPLPEGANFVVTTRIDSFEPTTKWQQASLMIYDDDNYFKWDLEFSHTDMRVFCCLHETDQSSKYALVHTDDVNAKSIWLRIEKLGKHYRCLTSTDGERFVMHTVQEWGDGKPNSIGLFAKNGGNKNAGELPAAFDFFELRSDVAPRVNQADKMSD